MRSSIYVVITGALIFLSAQGSGKFRVPRLKTATVYNHPVIAQTAPEFVEKQGRTTVLRRYYIARWGIHRYEYGYVNYFCEKGKCERDFQTTALKLYDYCKGFKKNGQPNCKGLTSARTDVSDPLETDANSGRAWYSCDDYGNPCRDRNYELEEFPSRYAPEDPEHGLLF